MVDTTETKNTAILALDVVNYSAKMNIDEKGTTEKLKKSRKIIEKLVETGKGRIFNTAGDSFMIEFNSTYNAVETAIKIQESLHKENSILKLGDRLEFRMGVNMGDVIIDGDDLLGDGVNVAARLESIAPPGGICVSEIVYNLVKSKINKSFIDKGKQKLKNIKDEIKCYYVDIKTGSIDPNKYKLNGKNSISKTLISLVAVSIFCIVITTSYLLINNKNTEFNIVAVSPIDIVSDDKDQINLAIGLTQDLSGGLKKAAKSLNIVTLNKKPEDISKLATDIGARYLISGNLRQAGEAIRISIKLTDTSNKSEVWTQNYDKQFTVSNVFKIQDEIVKSIVDELVGNGAILAQEVAKNFSNKGTSNMSAYECVNFIRGQYFKVLSPEMHNQGVECLRKAVLADPDYKEAWQLLAHMLAWGHSLYVPFLQSVTLEGLEEAEKAIDQAIRIDKDFARAYATRAELAFYKKDWKSLISYAKKAYDLAPLDAANVGHLSYIVTMSGLGCNSKEDTKNKYNIDKETCLRLNWGGELSKLGNKLDAVSSLSFDNYGLGFYYMENKNYEEMLNSFEAVPTPGFHWWNFWMALAHHYLGNFDKAKDYFSVIKPLYGENSIDTLNEGMIMWNFKKIYDEEVNKILIDNYGFK
jgi:adenylate cyclase